MAQKLSKTVAARRHASGGIFEVNTIDLGQMGELASPLALLDDFHVTGAPFGPHPHAGFSAITYVLEDSDVALRSRDSLGNDLVVRPGGIVWLQSGRGAQHQEVPATRGGSLHGAQIYVNLSAQNKMVAPQTFFLQPEDVPEWTDAQGNRIRVLVGRHGNHTSAIEPAERFTILDAIVVDKVSVASDEHTVLYVLDGEVEVTAAGTVRKLATRTALALAGVTEITLTGRAQVLVLSGPALNDPVHAEGPFIMNDAAGVRAALKRYHAGEMGQLDPV